MNAKKVFGFMFYMLLKTAIYVMTAGVEWNLFKVIFLKGCAGLCFGFVSMIVLLIIIDALITSAREIETTKK